MIPAHSSHRSCVRSAATPAGGAPRPGRPRRRSSRGSAPARRAAPPRRRRRTGNGTSSVDPTGSPAQKTTASGRAAARPAGPATPRDGDRHGRASGPPAVAGRVEQQQGDQPGEQEGAQARDEPVREVGAGHVPRQAVRDPAVERAVDGPHHGDRAEHPTHRVARTGEQQTTDATASSTPGSAVAVASPVEPRRAGRRWWRGPSTPRRRRRRATPRPTRRARGLCSREQYHRAGVPPSRDRGPCRRDLTRGTGRDRLPVGRVVGTANLPACRNRGTGTHHRQESPP